jgi:catechol 2,3-dioxygenase-like lactoylglutathione lyase family enzyme
MTDGLTHHGALVALADRPDGRLRVFYQSLLGEPARSLGAGYVEFHLVGGLRLGIFQPQPDQADRFRAAAPAAIADSELNSELNSGLNSGINSGIQSEPEPAIGPMGLCLEVPNLEAAMERAIACGARVRSAIRLASHGRELDAIDPVGNWLILYEPSHPPRSA